MPRRSALSASSARFSETHFPAWASRSHSSTNSPGAGPGASTRNIDWSIRSRRTRSEFLLAGSSIEIKRRSASKSPANESWSPVHFPECALFVHVQYNAEQPPTCRRGWPPMPIGAWAVEILPAASSQQITGSPRSPPQLPSRPSKYSVRPGSLSIRTDYGPVHETAVGCRPSPGR